MKANNVKQKPTTPESRKRSTIPGGAQFHGLYSSVARRENVTRSFVHQVATGKRTSKRIHSAIQREIKKRVKRLMQEAA